ncbi:MAG: hypothetical protein GY940_18785 [bacterium]|nr:hypothetical protein [bacterium]
MANKLKAINLLRPKLKMGRMITMDQVDPYVGDRTGLNRGTTLQVVNELSDALLFWMIDGRAVRLEAFGRFAPKIGLDGSFSISVKIDSKLQKRINDLGKYKGVIVNRDNIGLTPDELVTLWNELHPEDPVV